jgi:hypothetical protein
MHIGLTPDRLVCAGYYRSWRPTASRKEMIAVEAPRNSADWKPAVDALPAALARFRSGRRAVTVVLSNHFVRYALLPWIPTLKTNEDWLALARDRLAIVHGQTSDDWDIRSSQTTPQGPRVACAVDRALIEALESKIGESGATVVSVQPYLMAAFNRVRSAIANDSCWLAVEEPGRLTLALIQRGVWTAIRNRQADERWQAMLPDILERESAVLGLEQPCTQVIVHTQEAFEADPDSAFSMRDLTASIGTAPDERKFAMVLA